MLQLIEAGAQGLARSREAVEPWLAGVSWPLAQTRLLAPLPVPQSIRDCLVFESHLRNAMKAWEQLANRAVTPIPAPWFQRPT